MRNYKFPEISKTQTEVSQTIPNQSLSIKQLVQRHKNGQEVKQFRVSFDDKIMDDIVSRYGDVTKLNRLELTELAFQLRKENAMKAEIAKRNQVALNERIKITKEQRAEQREKLIKELEDEKEKDNKEKDQKPPK